MKVFSNYGKVLYLSLEEGHEITLRNTIERHFNEEEVKAGNVIISDHQMTYSVLIDRLKRQRSPKFVIIDSLQYWNINYDNYKELRRLFPNKSFLFISHAQGKEPLGATARSIRYDVGLKIRVEGYVGFVVSRYGGNNPFIIWEDGAKRYWAKGYHKLVNGTNKKPAKKQKKQPGPEAASKIPENEES
jgi:hypothetical protein